MNRDVANASVPSFLPLIFDCGSPGEIVRRISPNPNSAENSNERQSYAPHHQPGPKEQRVYIYALTHAHLRIS